MLTSTNVRNFKKIPLVMGLPNLVEIQNQSFNSFLQSDALPLKRKNEGLQSLLNELSPIIASNGKFSLEFGSYTMGSPRYSVTECIRRGITYSFPLKLKLKLSIYKNPVPISTRRKSVERGEVKKGLEVESIREEEVYLCDFPVMTQRGTFIINGIERVIACQLHRSPGAFFESGGQKKGKEIFVARIVPDRGTWMEFETDNNDLLYGVIGPRRRMLGTVIFRALGYPKDADIIKLFCEIEEINLTKKGFDKKLIGQILAEDVVDAKTGQKIAESKQEISLLLLKTLSSFGMHKIKIIKDKDATALIINTLRKDRTQSKEEALTQIYSRIRSGTPFESNTAETYLRGILFDKTRFDLGKIGRHRLNTRLNLDVPLSKRVLTITDIVAVVKELINLQMGKSNVDDIDRLGNRRVRSIGELMENQLRPSFIKLTRSIHERLLMGKAEDLMPHTLINPRLINSSLMEFFISSQLSQFMDQTNPLAELTHKRRLSALGPEGLTRERAGIEVRDVHPTHYGRICPIETPEGQNIGLITSLATYARINSLGLLEAPYRKVENKKVTNNVDYLTADEEDKFIIAQANAQVDKKGYLATDRALVRYKSDYHFMPSADVNYMDVDPIQTLSISACLIPFLEHDDSNRALMGSNMQRQAVPLMNPEPPLVQTGMEQVVAKESGTTVLAKRDGIIDSVSGDSIIVKVVSGAKSEDLLLDETDYYPLKNFIRSNQSTCVHQRPIVKLGQKVKKGDILADGPAIKNGKLSLGRNVLVAFMPWEGYNFEDAILVSEKIIKEDAYTSIHIEEFEVECRETKLGREEITPDIPNVSEEALKDLDSDGVIRTGAYVKAGDILVGKVTPKGESVLTSEEKLLRAIFGEKAGDVLNTSMKIPPGTEGVVIDTKIFSREEEDKKRLKDSSSEVQSIKRKKDALLESLEMGALSKIREIIKDKKSQKAIKIKPANKTDSPKSDKGLQIKAGGILSANLLNQLDFKTLKSIKVKDAKTNEKLGDCLEEFSERKKAIEKEATQEIKDYIQVEELSPGVIKLVKVYVASKRELQEGDKLSGRHGNKGVIAKVLPEEDMPYLSDGTPVDVVLNPLGVPSRMNLGQILETHLGWAAKALGFEAITPVFNGATEEEIQNCLKEASLPEDGKAVLFDGRTGEPFNHRITVGYIYLLKLDHLVEDKIHARSIGPYSLVTQQPLGGKARMGGQRFGEMEVWALEAYGAAHILQEMLTVKSDDIEGRTRTYEAIVKGENTLTSGIPESFNVLVKELQGLCLDFKIEKDKESTWDSSNWQWLNKERKNEASEIKSIGLGLASPQLIRSWSKGEVKKPETVNYRTFRAEKGGLFCEKIFGPTKDWECYCGKYKKIKHKGVVCDRCGVEVTESSVRRDRMGHIELVAPVAHIWMFRVIPSVMGTLLDMTLPNLEKLIYYDSWVVFEPGKTSLARQQILTDSELEEYRQKYGDTFEVGMGAPAVKRLLQELNLEKLRDGLQKKEKGTSSQVARRKINKRRKIVEAFMTSGNSPDWMILDRIPVIPPNLRPLVPLDKGGFASSDLNDLYRRVINRNNRLKRLIELDAPEIILRNEKRMLQEAIDALFDNGRRGRVVVGGTQGRPLKSLADTLGGKQGRFRQNLLGKRVDYSGRSVIVVDPKLKLDECGIPKEMALELFQPFIIRYLKEKGYFHTIKAGKKLMERRTVEVWEALSEVVKNHFVLLNRAPTLHRLGIQAFRPQLTESKAIKLHPMVCAAFGADFDGDTMSVHVPLFMETLLEAEMLILSTNNLFRPSDGSPILLPSQDMVWGLYYLTKMDSSSVVSDKAGQTIKEENLRFFSSTEEAKFAYELGEIKLHTPMLLRIPERFRLHTKSNKLKTTTGRAIFNEVLPDGLEFVNEGMTKSKLSSFVDSYIKQFGKEATCELLDNLKEIGFHYATIGGLSIGITDVLVPPDKWLKIDKARKEVGKIERQYHEGIITYGERYNKLLDVWSRVGDEVAQNMFSELKKHPFNPVLLIMESEARGSAQQIRQLGGMRGLIARPRKQLTGAVGEIIEFPITTNFREGLSVLEYFISTHGGRKGLADTALKTAQAGYLTRRLVDVAQNVIVREEDCGTVNGIIAKPLELGGRNFIPLKERIIGRTTIDDIKLLLLDEIIAKAGDEITEEIADAIQEAGIEEVSIRSVLTCQSKEGICAKCYGKDLATGTKVALGQAVGIMAAQSIGEPGTQLTLRTFHIGGTASRIVGETHYTAQADGVIRFQNLNVTKNSDGKLMVLNRNGSILLEDEEGNKIENYSINVGSFLEVSDGQKVKAKEVIARWDPYTRPLLSEIKGKVEFKDLIKGLTMKEELNRETNIVEKVVIEHRGALHPQIIVRPTSSKTVSRSGDDYSGQARYYPLPTNAHITVNVDEKIEIGTLLAKTPREVVKATDITGGLPRIAELFEARKPKNPAIVTEIDGNVKEIVMEGSVRDIVIEGANETRRYAVPHGKHIEVDVGDWVTAGQKLTDGPAVTQEILRIEGERKLQQYLLNEIQEVYRLQGVKINDKHIEIIIRQMLMKVQIEDPGDTSFLWGEQIEKGDFQKENERVVSSGGGKPAKGRPLVLGITKASLASPSFISAASFQETPRVLTRSAIFGRKDELKGLKENLMIGKLIPAGTGLQKYREIEVIKNADT
ncbi:MAG: DNA-directed RNA polymerase subunit beta [Candidatus Omnitrophica bacterium]|nr:DNA-directed RNA polymerase subunit beta [Candidatus Omnitrophota bacterium]MBU1047018.1 DNA-directed RNA polymerase subunit beta [Candidatus Omnitrophota bacterium]MBU1889616.1 DNA-directed RNA polymerase subunit beta [Candidatus Omnitrophota bacterium]